VPLLSGLFVLVGVGFAQVVTIWTHRRSGMRADVQRWDQERRLLYAEVVRLARDVEAAWSALHLGAPDATYEEAARALRLAGDQVELLGSERVVDAARNVCAATDGPLLRPDDSYPLRELEAAQTTESLLIARSEFLLEVRQELGVVTAMPAR